MNRVVVSIISAVIISGAAIAAQEKGSSSGSADAGKAVTFRGCLQPGSAPNTFTLSNASEKGVKGAAKASLKVVPGNNVNLAPNVTQDVEITGTVSTGKDGELRTINATKVKFQGEHCG